LAAGQSSSLIAAHFQVDDRGRINLPTLGGSVDAAEHSSFLEEQRAFLELLASTWPAIGIGEGQEAPTPVIYSEEEDRAELLGCPAERLITLGPFRWRTLHLGGDVMLAAVREVATDRRTLTQGFLVAAGAMEDCCETAPCTVRVLDGPPAAAGEAALPLGGPQWRVVVDLGGALARAESEAAAVRTRFLRLFLLGTGAAMIAGLAVIGVVWQIARLSTARARFAAAAAHELRSPLAGIRLYGDMLADQLGRPDKSRDYARKMAHEAQRLGRVVGNVLGYSRLEKGPLPVRPEPGDLRGAVLEAVERLKPSVEASGASLVVSAEDDLPPIAFDHDAVQHIVQNLVDNAERFSRDSDNRTIEIRLREHGNGASLSVVDRGPGIPPGLRRRLFRPFAGAGKKGGREGLGLGLVLVRALVDAHGGSLGHEETPGGGATFNVFFPS
jgi:signal transduction histidine kinase